MKISILEEDTPGTSKEEFVSLEEDTLGTSNEEFAILVLRKVPLGTSNEEFAILQEVNLLALWSPLPIGTNLIKHIFPTPVLNPLLVQKQEVNFQSTCFHNCPCRSPLEKPWIRTRRSIGNWLASQFPISSSTFK